MELLIIRHAIARDKVAFARTGRSDSERPLTKHGRRKFKKCLKVLKRAAPRLDLLATSPFVRAAETCALARGAYPKARLTTLAALASGGKLGRVIRWLSTQPRDAVVGIVGHEPDLSELTARLLPDSSPTILFRKGGAGLISFDGRAATGRGRLEWLLTPGLMKRLR